MPNKFLTVRNGVSGNLDDGTQDIYVKSVTVANLEPTKPVKTNPTGTLNTSLLIVSDVDGLEQRLANTLTNPYNDVLTVEGLVTSTKITNGKLVSLYTDDYEMVSKQYVDLKISQDIGVTDSPTFKNISTTDSVISSLIPSHTNLYNLGSYQTIWKNVFCDYFTSNGVETKYVTFKSDMTSDRFRFDFSAGVMKCMLSGETIFDVDINGIIFNPDKKITSTKSIDDFNDENEMISKSYVDSKISSDIECTSISVKNNANYYGLRLQSTTNLSIVENTLALGDQSNTGVQVNLISFFIKNNDKFTIGATDVDNSFFITKNSDTRLLKYDNGDGLLELNGGKVAIRQFETAFQDRIVGTDLGSNSNPFDNIYVNNIISSSFDSSKTQNIILTEPGKTVFYNQIDVYHSQNTSLSTDDDVISIGCTDSLGKIISGSGISNFGISSNNSNLILSAYKNNDFNTGCLISLEPSESNNISVIRCGFGSNVSLTIKPDIIETTDIKTSQYSSINAVLSKVIYVGATNIFEIQPTGSPDVNGVSIITNFFLNQ